MFSFFFLLGVSKSELLTVVVIGFEGDRRISSSITAVLVVVVGSGIIRLTTLISLAFGVLNIVTLKLIKDSSTSLPKVIA